MKFTRNEILRLQVGQTLGPLLMTRSQIHKAQANICAHKAKFIGSEFNNYSEPATGLQPDGSEVQLKGWFNWYVTRTATGVNADTGEAEVVC